MQLKDIATKRLYSQQIIQSKHNSPAELVRWMGAVQAQDFSMVQWALGLRMANASLKSITDAMDKGEIIRTHAMRPTWHLVAAEDIYWMLELTAPQIKSSLKSRHKFLGLTEKMVAKSHTIITNSIALKGQATRQELAEALINGGFERSDNRHAHLLILTELDGLICSGKTKGKNQTYALLEERVPKKKLLSHEESLAELAQRYFKSHSPATLKDFVWWSGLYVKDAKRAIEIISKDLNDEIVGEQTYYIHHSIAEVATLDEEIHLLPAFDEFIISYRDRSASITSEQYRKAISNNGIFWPIIIINGEVQGTWKRTIKKNKVHIEVSLFTPQTKGIEETIKNLAQDFGTFIDKQVELVHKK